MENDAHTYRSWLSLSDLDAASEQFEYVRKATDFKIMLPNKTVSVVTRIQLDELASGPEAARIMCWPVGSQ